MGYSTVYFPIVGAVIGLILAGLSWLFGLFLPLVIVNALLIVSLVIISGALHLDGFIDTCDGIAGHKTVEDRWEVMHDSRAGAFGIVGVVLLLMVKYAALSSVPENSLMATLVLMTVVSRWTMVYAVFAYPYARPSGLGKTLKQGTSWQGFTIATIITLAAVIGLSRWADIKYFFLVGPALMLTILVIVVAMSEYFKRKFSGLTGDTYGAICEVTEVCVLIIICVLAHNSWLI
jgi:adenosylcobinamide-GDP ribazoletransferase